MSKRYANTYESPRSIQIMDDIQEMMRNAEYVTPNEVATAMKLSHASVGSYLRAMVERGLAICIQRSFNTGTQGGSSPSRWTIAKEGEQHAPGRARIDERRVIVSSKWEQRKLPPMFEPMAYLFGRAT